MSKKLNKKSRIGLSAAAGLLAASGSIAPLTMATSCGQSEIKNSVVDKEYGVTKETYEDLKEQFRIEYSQKLAKIYDVKSEDYRIRMEALEQDLSSLDKIANAGKTPYTAITQLLVDFAREHNQKYPTGNAIEVEPYGIQLVRHTRTKWSDLNDLYVGVADSFKTYMHNSKMPTSTINRILTQSKIKFDALVKQLKATYGNDALSGLLKAKEQMITFFDEVNEEIALVSATLRLKDFMSEFAFNCKDYNDDGTYCKENRLDVLQKDKNFQVGKVLTNDLMNKIFTITRNTTSQNVKFDAKTIVPGYIVQPKLTKVTEDPFSNTYSICIDFGLVKNIYVQKYANDPEKLALLTAHIFNLNTDSLKQQAIDENTSIAEFLRNAPAKSLEYTVHLTPQEEANRLEQTYFNHDSEHGSITFNWTNDKSKQAYEAFFDNARQDKNDPNKWTGSLSTQSLVNAGLTISCDGKKYTLVSQGDDKQDNFLSDDYNLQGVFLKNCALVSDVEIIEGNQKVVNHNFKAVYANSIYRADIKDESPMYNVDPLDYNNQCIDFNVSTNFYQKVNAKFNEAAQFVLVYNATLKNASKSQNELSDEDEAKLKRLEGEVEDLFLAQKLEMLGVAITMGMAFIFILLAYETTKSKFWLWFGLINNAIALLLQGANYCVFVHYCYEKITDDAKKVRDAQNKMDDSSLVNMLKKDLNDNFVLINDDGTYDKVKFAQQRDKFEKNHMSDMLNMYRKYATINQYDNNGDNTDAQIAMKGFNDILSECDITVDDIEDDLKEWQPGGKFFAYNLGIVLGVVLANILSSIGYGLMFKQQPAADAAPENTVKKANDESLMNSATVQEDDYATWLRCSNVNGSIRHDKGVKSSYENFLKIGENKDIGNCGRFAVMNALFKAISRHVRKVYKVFTKDTLVDDPIELENLKNRTDGMLEEYTVGICSDIFGFNIPKDNRCWQELFNCCCFQSDDSFIQAMNKILTPPKWWKL